MDRTDYIFGIRAVIEAIEAGRDVDTIYMKKGLQGELVNELLALVKLHRLPIRRVPEERLGKFTRKNHQGVVATLSAVTYASSYHSSMRMAYFRLWSCLTVSRMYVISGQ